MIAATLVFGLALGQHVVSMGQSTARGKNRDLSPDTAAVPSPLGREIRRYLADLRQASLDRALRQVPPPVWFHSWDEPPSCLDGWEDTQSWPDGWQDAEPWWDKGDPDQPIGGPAGLAISLVEVDGRYEIEAALADEQGQRKFRACGSREEIEQWLTELPPRVRKAIQRRLPASDDGADAACGDLPKEKHNQAG
jgi:hypothetical protein